MSSITAFTGSIPHNYETFLGPLFFEPYALDLVQRFEGDAYGAVLELACGTGRVTRHLVGKVAADGKLLATDLNEDMLRIAKAQVQDRRVEWMVADAHRLPFENQAFDLVVCQFGIMFFEDKPKALREIFRVLKPGGCFYFSNWDRIEFNAVADVARQVVQEIFPDDLPAFIAKGPYSFFDTDVIRHLLTGAGFVTIEIEKVAITSVASAPEDAITGFLDGTTLSPYLQERHAQATAVRQLFRELLVLRYGEKDLELHMQALVCEGVKPGKE